MGLIGGIAAASLSRMEEAQINPAEHVELPRQEQIYRPPKRFGHTPVAREPLGWDARQPGFRNHYPNVRLPIQVVERVSTNIEHESGGGGGC